MPVSEIIEHEFHSERIYDSRWTCFFSSDPAAPMLLLPGGDSSESPGFAGVPGMAGKPGQNHLFFRNINTPITDRKNEIPMVMKKACGEC